MGLNNFLVGIAKMAPTGSGLLPARRTGIVEANGTLHMIMPVSFAGFSLLLGSGGHEYDICRISRMSEF